MRPPIQRALDALQGAHRRDFAELALEALDQAGLPLIKQDHVARMLSEALGEVVPIPGRVLHLSGRHLKPSTQARLDDPENQGRRVVTHATGWMVDTLLGDKFPRAPYARSGSDAPTDLIACLAVARGYDWVRFDRDAPVDPRLPVYGDAAEDECRDCGETAARAEGERCCGS